MRISDKTVIITCAGMGTRLKMNTPKATIDVDGKPLLIRTLEMLDDVEDIRIIVGYKADSVINLAKKYRDNLSFIYNHDFANTGTGASVLLGTKNAKKFILTIDGDIIIHPDDMRRITQAKEEFVGVCNISTDDPVLTITHNRNVVGFSRERGNYEWTGVTMLKSNNLPKTVGHTYQIIEPLLPIPFRIIRQKEIDTPNDYRNAVKWVKNNYKDEEI